MCWCAPTTQRWSLTSTTKEVCVHAPVQAGVPDPWVVPGQIPLSENSSHSWASQYGSRHPVEAGAEAPGKGCFTLRWLSTSGESLARHRWRNDSAMSPLVISDSSSSTGAGCHGTDVAEASSVCLSPNRSAPGSSGESVPERGQSTSGSTVLAGPNMVLWLDFSPWWLSMGNSHQEGSPLTGVGLSPWGGTTHSFQSLNRGCWDHHPIQSSLNKETVCLEVENFHFMVQRPPARPSQLPDWYSSGVPACPSLCRVDPLHLEGLCSGNAQLLPFGSLTSKSLIVCVQCEASVLYTNKTIAALMRPSNLWQLVVLHQLHNYLPHIRYVALLLPDNIETVSDRLASLCCKPQSL